MSDPGSSCERCADLRQVVRIGNQRSLRMAHRVVMGNFADNTIYEVGSPSKNRRAVIVKDSIGVQHDPDPSMPDFATLLKQDHLPDIIQTYFRCSACNLLFELHADTCHGSGGEWRPAYDEDAV